MILFILLLTSLRCRKIFINTSRRSSAPISAALRTSHFLRRSFEPSLHCRFHSFLNLFIVLLASHFAMIMVFSITRRTLSIAAIAVDLSTSINSHHMSGCSFCPNSSNHSHGLVPHRRFEPCVIYDHRVLTHSHSPEAFYQCALSHQAKAKIVLKRVTQPQRIRNVFLTSFDIVNNRCLQLFFDFIPFVLLHCHTRDNYFCFYSFTSSWTCTSTVVQLHASRLLVAQLLLTCCPVANCRLLVAIAKQGRRLFYRACFVRPMRGGSNNNIERESVPYIIATTGSRLIVTAEATILQVEPSCDVVPACRLIWLHL